MKGKRERKRKKERRREKRKGGEKKGEGKRRGRKKRAPMQDRTRDLLLCSPPLASPPGPLLILVLEGQVREVLAPIEPP